MIGIKQTEAGIRQVDHAAYQEHLKGLSEEALRHILKDALEASDAVGRDNPNQGSYQDELSYALAELRRRG